MLQAVHLPIPYRAPLTVSGVSSAFSALNALNALNALDVPDVLNALALGARHNDTLRRYGRERPEHRRRLQPMQQIQPIQPTGSDRRRRATTAHVPRCALGESSCAWGGNELLRVISTRGHGGMRTMSTISTSAALRAATSLDEQRSSAIDASAERP